MSRAVRGLGPKPCPSCERVLPRSAFYAAGGKCKPYYKAHRIQQGTDPTSTSREKRAARDRTTPAPGRDFMAEAQVALGFAGAYARLSREAAARVRAHAVALARAAGAWSAAWPAWDERPGSRRAAAADAAEAAA